MIKLAIKDLKLFFKDKRSVMLSFALPIVLISLFAFAYGGAGNDDEDTRISMQISDLDQSDISRKAVQAFDTLKGIQLKHVALEQAQDNIKKGKESCVLILQKGFSDSLNSGRELPLEFQYDEAKEIEVGLLQQSLIPTIAMLPFNIGDPRLIMKSKFGMMMGNSDDALRERVNRQSDSLFDDLSKGLARGESKGNTASGFFGNNIKMTKLVAAKKDNTLGLVQAVAGTAVMMLLFSVVGIGMGILEEKQEGTLKRLLYTPMNPMQILFGKMLAANVISVLQLVVIFLFAGLVFGLDIFSHAGGLIITILATAFACSAFGVFLASFAKSRAQVQGLSTLIVLVMSAIGGSMMPIFFMPAIMQKIGLLSVNYWSIQSFFDVFWRNLPVTSWTYLSRILVLLFTGVVLNVLAAVMFKRNVLKLS